MSHVLYLPIPGWLGVKEDKTKVNPEEKLILQGIENPKKQREDFGNMINGNKVKSSDFASSQVVDDLKWFECERWMLLLHEKTIARGCILTFTLFRMKWSDWIGQTTKEQRHRNMKNIKSKDTSIELKLRRELWK